MPTLENTGFFVVFPYEYLFRTIRTHVLSNTPLTGDAPTDIQTILLSLQEGHCFASNDYVHNAKGTRFSSADGRLTMGDEATFGGPTDGKCPHNRVKKWCGHLSR